MDKNIKRAAVALLRAHRRAEEKAQEQASRLEQAKKDEAERLMRVKLLLIRDAREYGMTWNEIANVLGHANGHAMRMWYRRTGGEL